ncbi:MAG: hypothetical protein U1C04_10145 [Hydrogenophaga sp.]|nr:hypothetical protein [Hydrogenophaga sp.]MDZ4281119.1 hypothetical protein [Hydrogenophaga sp.]
MAGIVSTAIEATAWTANVTAGTDQEPGRRFKRSVHVGAAQTI